LPIAAYSEVMEKGNKKASGNVSDRRFMVCEKAMQKCEEYLKAFLIGSFALRHSV
jgi:hypothetical protein